MIVRFAEVAPGLFRSGRYRARTLGELVDTHGIKRVIDLRDRPPLFTARTYQRMGVEFLRCPIDEYAPLDLGRLDQIVRLALETPTLVHCWKGSHRTGVVVAWYRITKCAWSNARAYQEMQEFDFGKIGAHELLFESVFGEWRP